MTFAERTTIGGYNCAEVASALQKCIRRGLEDDALFWATELDRSNFGEYVWKRLRIIASEDIGYEAPSIAIEIRVLFDNWKDQRKKEDVRHAPERLFLIDAVMRLCRAKKSRAVDHALIVFYEGPRAKRPIPDFALDRHTGRGRAMRRRWRHFWEEGARLEGCEAPPDPYAAQARLIRHDAQDELPLE
jgi:replication-associated recombination protein RarA